LLLIGVPDIYFKQVKELLLNVDEKIKRNIKLTRILEEDFESRRRVRHTQQMIFS
jgi:hypothetical protein